MLPPADPTLAALRDAVQPIPTALRTPLTRLLIASVRPGDAPEATVRRALADLDRRILRAERRRRNSAIAGARRRRWAGGSQPGGAHR